MEQLISLICKNCGAELVCEEGTSNYICESCGSAFCMASDGSKSEEFSVIAGVLEGYMGTSVKVIVPKGVIAIGNGCFKGSETIESVVLPDGIKKIGDEAFAGCKALKHIEFPKSLKEIGNAAFKNSLIESAELSNISNIGQEAFMLCTELKKLTLPSKDVIIQNRAFKNCYALTDVECGLDLFCLSFKPSTEARKEGDTRPTLFDAFQATPFFQRLRAKFAEHRCLICGNELKKCTCDRCGAFYGDLKGGCYVASAIYGSYNCPEVWVLRRYRDHTLAKTWYGRAFIRVYYAVSPLLVKWFGNKKWFKKLWIGKLNRLVDNLKANGVSSEPYEDIIW